MELRKENGILYFEDENRGKAKFSLKDGTMWVIPKGKKEYEQRKSLAMYFKNIRIYEVEKLFENDKILYQLLKLIRKHCRQTGSNINSIGNLLSKIKYHSNFESLMSYGIDLSQLTKFSIYHYEGQEYENCPKNILKYLGKINYQLSDINSIYNKTFHKIVMAHIELNENFMSNYYEDYLHRISRLINEYNYNHIHLIKYLNYIREYENINWDNATSFLIDYYRMKKQMLRKPDGTYKSIKSIEKYPKYLKSNHDIISKQYSIFKETYDENLFRSKYTEKDFIYNDKKYFVSIPYTTDEVKQEGENLHHCVKSYIEHVIDNKCHILFMREKPEESLITMEYRESDNAIVQIKGMYNRNPTQEEYSFIKKYCKIKGFELKVKLYEDSETEECVA